MLDFRPAVMASTGASHYFHLWFTFVEFQKWSDVWTVSWDSIRRAAHLYNLDLLWQNLELEVLEVWIFCLKWHFFWQCRLFRHWRMLEEILWAWRKVWTSSYCFIIFGYIVPFPRWQIKYERQKCRGIFNQFKRHEGGREDITTPVVLLNWARWIIFLYWQVRFMGFCASNTVCLKCFLHWG